MPTVLIAFNPRSGTMNRQALVAELVDCLEARGYVACVVHDLKELESRVQDLLDRRELLAVVAAGGDGTISAVLTRIPPQCPIAVLPLGSENLLAKHYRIPRSPAICAAAIAKNEPVVLDAMEVSNAHLQRPMIATLMATVGFDSDVVRLVHQNRRSHITRWAYRFQILYSWWTYRWPALRITTDQSWEARWLFVFNIPRYATGLKIIEDADPTDGLLAIGFFTKSGRIRGLLQYLSVLCGLHRRRSDWRELKATGVRIDYLVSEVRDSQRDPPGSQVQRIASLQVDGDWAGELPAEIKLLPQHIRLLVP